MSKPKILFLIGSPNQTSQMHQISLHLGDFDCYFSQIFDDDPVVEWGVRRGWLEHTVISGEFKRKADAYLEDHRLQSDYRGKKYLNEYRLIVFCSDMIVPRIFKNHKKLWVQEGMIDQVNWRTILVKKFSFYRWMTLDTSLNGSSDLCDIYCAASEGYKEFFSTMGTNPGKIIATGIPNHDNAALLHGLHFPYRNFVLVATSDIRECYGMDHRTRFIRKCVRIADGRQLIFKLHPNEKKERAITEIRKYAPNAMIMEDGNINPMIVHCEELITQYSTVVYTGLALGKKVHSYFPLSQLKKMAPIQNGGTSSVTIANVCSGFALFNGTGPEYLAGMKTNIKKEKIQFLQEQETEA